MTDSGGKQFWIVAAIAALGSVSLGCVAEVGAPPDPNDPQVAKTSSAVVAEQTTKGTITGKAPENTNSVPQPEKNAGGDDEGPRPHPWTPPATNDGQDNDEGPRPHPWTPPTDNDTTTNGGTGTGSNTTDGSGTTKTTK